MAVSTPGLSRQNGLLMTPAIVKLAGWRFKRMWRSLFFTWLGMLAMVVLICAGPLFTNVSISAYARSLVTSAPDGSYVTVAAVSSHPAAAQLQQIEQHANQVIRASQLGPYQQEASQLIIQTPPLDMLANGRTQPQALRLAGYDTAQASQHVSLVQGRLPQVTGDGTLEIALSQAAISNLGLHLGDSFQGRYPIAIGSPAWTLRVVGIIAPKLPHDSFWAMADPFSASTVDLTTRYYTVLNGEPYANVLAANAALEPKIASLQSVGSSFSNNFLDEFVFFLRYPIDLSRLNANALPALSQQTGNLDGRVEDALQQHVANLNYANAFGTLLSTLQNSTGQLADVEISVTFLLLIILCLALYLVSMMSDVLVEQQAVIIATLRSRGATRGHVFGAFVAQGLVLGSAALLLGPLLALLLVRLLAQVLLTPESQQSLSVITSNPLQSALDVKWFAVVAVALALVTMIVAVNRASKMNIVTLRRESSRVGRIPLWRRLNLDLFVTLLLLVGYAAFLYFWPALTIAGGQIDPAVYVTLTNLGAVYTPLVVVAALLLFSRLFPLILHLATFLATKRRSAPAVLALAQMQRTPRPAARVVVLLALAIATSVFMLTLITAKEQRNLDAANFYVRGADFSGILPQSDSAKTFAQLQSYYSGLTGVHSASLGYHDVIQLDSDPTITGQGTLTIEAVDPSTYARTTSWSPSYSSQSAAQLMAQLASQRSSGNTQHVVYALVDTATWQRLRLTPGAQFDLPVTSSGSAHLHFIALAHINYVPGVYDNAAVLWSGMGLIVDYQNYTTVKAAALAATTATIPPNYLWLRTSADPATLATLRNTLPGLSDRRAILATMQDDPGHLGIIGVLDIAVAAALLLALVGTLIASWFSASTRLTNFALVRALGMAPRQVAALLLWEQGFIYALALLLGLGLGVMLSIFVAPTVSALTIMHGHAWDVPLNVPPIQVVVPFIPLLFLLGALALICVASLLLMARIVSRPALSQVLRLNED